MSSKRKTSRDLLVGTWKGVTYALAVSSAMKLTKIFVVLCVTAFLMRSHPAAASILVDYYRLPQAEREKVTKDQATWDTFKTHLIKAQSKAMRDALDKLKLDGLSKEERWAKINAAIEKSHDPAHFNMEKDWHIIAYLLTGDPTLKEEHLPVNLRAKPARELRVRIGHF
jgi:hypothetical protein